MNRLGLVVLVLLVVVAAAVIGYRSRVTAPAAPAPTPTQTLAPTPTPTVRPSSTPTPTFVPPATRPPPTPTPTPVVGPIRVPTPTPSPTPVNPGTTVAIESVELGVGSKDQAALAVRGITDPRGLGAFELVVKYDPSAIKVEEVKPPEEFTGLEQEQAVAGGTLVSRIIPEKGEVNLVGFQTNIPGPTGNVQLAYLTLEGIKTGSWSLEIRLSVLANSDGKPIPAVTVPGTVIVR